jgi:hypothetical protein
MGNPSILKEEIMKEFLWHFRSSIPQGGVPGILGMLLMVLVFSIERFFISQAAGKTKWFLQ